MSKFYQGIHRYPRIDSQSDSEGSERAPISASPVSSTLRPRDDSSDEGVPAPRPIPYIPPSTILPGSSPAPAKKQGRPSIWNSFTVQERDEVMTAIAAILEDASPKAHARRQDEITLVGVTIAEIKAQLFEKVLWLKKTAPDLSETTIRHWFTPPHKGRNSASLFQSLFDARPARGENDEHDFHVLVCTLHRTSINLLLTRSGTCLQRNSGLLSRAIEFLRCNDDLCR